MSVIAMWAHPRAASTAFLRMMLERGDVLVVHEPLVTLTDEGEVPVSDGDGGTVVLRSAGQVLAHLAELGRNRTVFFKDTLEFRYQHLFDHPEEIAGFTNTFIVRDPKKAINSHYAMKPTVTRSEIGYEHQYDLFQLVKDTTGREPVVVQAERLLGDPAAVVDAYCSAVGLDFLPHALRWQPEDRGEWHRTRKWHIDVIGSSGFQPVDKTYPDTVDNNDELKDFYDYHYPFYQRLVAHSI